jgi:hypothetical protein
LAFSRIDASGDGILTVADLAGRYDTSHHPDVIAGKKTSDQVLREFLDTFEVGNHDGTVL